MRKDTQQNHNKQEETFLHHDVLKATTKQLVRMFERSDKILNRILIKTENRENGKKIVAVDPNLFEL